MTFEQWVALVSYREVVPAHRIPDGPFPILFPRRPKIEDDTRLGDRTET